jgi:hypothetical protein
LPFATIFSGSFVTESLFIEYNWLMEMTEIINGLRLERVRLNNVICALEGLAGDRHPRRCRPPKWMSQAKHALVKRQVKEVPAQNAS